MRETTTFVVFGITSNLAQKKLIPALFDLWKKKVTDTELKIVGIFRQDRSANDLRQMISSSIDEENTKFNEIFCFIKGDVGEEELYEKIKKKTFADNGNVVYYLSTFPEYYSQILENIHKFGMTKKKDGFVRLVLEKPLGDNYETAVELNRLLNNYFEEEQIYRIDHYLGKETYQNILAFRFGNEFLKNAINAENVDHVQITVSETAGVEDRIGFYDKVGALKDIGQNHMIQLLVAAAMSKPKLFCNKDVTIERIKVIDKLKAVPESLVLGRYEDYPIADSKVNTFFAFKAIVGEGELKGIPVYVRSGKRMTKDITEISIVFKNNSPVANVLIYRIKPEEGIMLKVAVKKPGYKMNLTSGTMKFCFKGENGSNLSAYEKLFVDMQNGDPTFFNDGIEVESQWKFIDKYAAVDQKVRKYEAGSWGPEEADRMIEKDGRKWLVPEDSYCGR